MKRNILHIAITLVALLVTNSAWGQTNISGTWAGGSLTGSYKLIGNTKLTNQISVQSATLTIDLNGYTLERDLTKYNSGKEKTAFIAVVSTNKTLVIKDSKGGGVIENGRGDRGGAILISGKVQFEGGTIQNCIATDGDYGDEIPQGTTGVENWRTQGCGGAFFVNEGATLEMSGTAKISNCRTEVYNTTNNYGRGGAVYVAGTFNMTEGTIDGCQATSGGAVFVHGGYKNGNAADTDTRLGTFKMSGGTIKNCKAAVHGPGVYTYGSVEISGTASIESNSPQGWGDVAFVNGYPQAKQKGIYGGGIYAEGEKAIVTMSGGTIMKNQGASGGGVMLWVGSQMNMTGGEISENYALGVGGLGNGGAVYVQNAELNISGGTIKGNYANRYGGAVNQNQSGGLNISGNCQITENEACHGGGISQEAGECILKLASEGIVIGKNKAHGHSGAYTNGSYTVSTKEGNGGGLFIERGTLEITGAQIIENEATGHGGGVSIYANRIAAGNLEVKINGNVIIDNNSAKSGGGLDIYGYCEMEDNRKNNINVELLEGSLTNNKALENGAGIYVSFDESKSTATMTIGTVDYAPIVKGNIATNNGGGLGMSNNGVFDVKNISLSENSAANGGGIWLGTGTFTITEGTIKNNTASTNGGAIYVGSGTFTMNGQCEATGNKATNGHGGAIYLGGGTFTVDANATMNIGSQGASNTASNGNGGGVYCASTFTINGKAVVSYNEANNGGGVCVEGGTVSIADGKGTMFTDNKATQYGGGLYVYNNTSSSKDVTFKGGTFKKNTAMAGGGICAMGDMNLTFSANAEDNTAENGGGIYMADGVNMKFGTGLIRNNNATTSNTTKLSTANKGVAVVSEGNANNNIKVYGVGGGIFMANNTTLDLSKIEELGIYGNNATYAAADIFANGVNTQITKLPNIENGNFNFSEFDVRSSSLYWAHDYVNEDTDYKGGYRYEYMLVNDPSKITKLEFADNVTTTDVDRYICLDLGYDYVYIELIAEGLGKDQYAEVQLSLQSHGTNEEIVPYTKVLFNGVEEGNVTKIIGLPSGSWQFDPTNWMYHIFSTPKITTLNKEVNGVLTKIEQGKVNDEAITTERPVFTIKFTELQDTNKKNVIEAYKRVVNYMK